MAQYIDKDTLVAEIEKRKEAFETSDGRRFHSLSDQILWNAFNSIQDILDTLEVKEVDLEKETENLIEKEKAFVTGNREVKYYNGDSFNHIYELEFIAKHFFELGLKAQKGE